MSNAWRTAVLKTFLSFHKKNLTRNSLQCIFIICFQELEIVGIVPMDYTTPNKAVLASVFKMAEHPVFTAYNRTRTAIAMDGRTVQIKPKKWPNIHLYIKEESAVAPGAGIKYSFVDLGSNQTISSCFTFQKVRDDDIFTCKSIDDTLKIKIGTTKTGNFGIATNTGNELKLIRLFEMNSDTDRQLYLIALVQSPAKFVWVLDEKPSLKVGDPGEQGYWYLDQAGVEDARSRRSDCFSMLL